MLGLGTRPEDSFLALSQNPQRSNQTNTNSWNLQRCPTQLKCVISCVIFSNWIIVMQVYALEAASSLQKLTIIRHLWGTGEYSQRVIRQ